MCKSSVLMGTENVLKLVHLLFLLFVRVDLYWTS